MPKYSTLGAFIKAARMAVGLDQKELAQRLEIGQQAVSSWERGLSRPRQSQLPVLCSLLSLEIGDVTLAGEYEAQIPPSSHRLLTLPFENLSDEAFEAFCRDLVSFRYPKRTATRNGSTGQKQYGVDVFVDGAGERVGVQCKRRKNFGPADISTAIDEVLPEAKITSGVITLSRRTASATARLELAKYPAWSLWDGEDLSRLVRELPIDQALVLVDTYFDGLREDFLGVRQPSPWLTPSEYDGALPGRLGVDRNFELVGRSDDFARLTELTSNHESLVLLVGRGGIGKTRLLREFALSDQGRPVRFVARGPVSPESYPLLPKDAPIVVIDDATDSEFDLSALVRGVLSVRPEATVVLSVRPRLIPHLRSLLDLAEAETTEVTVELGDLTMSEAKSLAREALGNQATDTRAESLARIGYDCPFLLVVGAHLVRTNKLSDADLASQAVLRREILTRFADIVVGGPSAVVWKSILAAIAAVQPAPLDEPEFLDCIAVLAGQDHDQVLEGLDDLEDLGLILRRQQSVRVVPDLLGDAILERALVSDSGIEKRFAGLIADHATGRALTHSIRNVSIIDWHRRSDGPSQLANVLWSALTLHALGLSNSDRIELGKRVAPVAAIYPDQALDLVDKLLANPVPDEDDPFSRIWGELRQITNEDLERSLAPLIANVGHNLGHLDHAMRLLLRIGSRDQRAENSNPDHALRLMRELGEFHPRRAVAFNERYVEVISTLLQDEGLAAEGSTLVTMLKSALAHVVVVTESKGLSLMISRSVINIDVVATVRSKAIAVATECLASDHKIAIAAIDVLGDSLQSSDPTDPVTEEFVQVAETLGRVIADPGRPAGLRLSAYRALGWHAAYGNGERRQLARQIRTQLAQDDDYVLARVIRSGWDIDEDEDDDADSSAVSRYYRATEATDQAVEGIINRWISRGEGGTLLDRVRVMMNSELSTKGRFSSPDGLLLRLFATAPEVARGVVMAPKELGPVDEAVLRAALITLLEAGDVEAETAAEVMIGTDVAQAMVVASAVMNSRTPFNRTRRRLTKKLIKTDFPGVHLRLLSAARWLDPVDKGLTLEMLHAAPIESEPDVADAAAGVLADGDPPIWTALMPEERKAFLDRFGATPKLRPFSLGELLNREIRIDPFSALEFLQQRIDRRALLRTGFDPVPHVDSMHLDFQSSTKLSDLVDFTVEWILEDDSWERQFYGKQILEPMLVGYGEEARSLIRRLIRSRNEQRIKLANLLLDEAPHDFVVREQEFVIELIEDAQQMSDSLRRHVIAGLHGSAEYGMHSRSVGIDDPKDVALRDGAKIIVERYSKGSPVREFYEDVARRASRRLDSERADDRSLEDPRAW